MLSAGEPEASEPPYNVVGERVALGPHRHDLLPLHQKRLNDPEPGSMHGAPLRPMTLEDAEAWCRSPRDRRIEFTVYEYARARPIGIAGLHDVDTANRTAAFSMVVGEKDCWGQGYGTEATRLMLDYGFTALELHNISLRVYSFNERGIRAYARARFKLVGRLREVYRLGGRAHDVVNMDCLASEFESPALCRLGAARSIRRVEEKADPKASPPIGS